MDLLGGFMETQQNRDQLVSSGQAIERLVMSYPPVSKELVVGLHISGQLRADTGLIDEIVQRDLLAQRASNDDARWKALKTGIRRGSVILEDLYNNAPFQTLPRIGINMWQGDSFVDALDQAQGSSLQNEIMLNKLGFDIDYGQGFFPSEELIPQSAEYWALIKQQLMDGTFDGSVEEQILAVQQQAKLDQAYGLGVNPYALARAEWQSTIVHKQYGGMGEIYAAPYSPGSGVMIHFTNPGTRLYGMGSALVDGAFRITMEPGDFALDNIGDVVRASFDPRVGPDIMSYTSRGSHTARAIVEESGVAYLDDPFMAYTGKYDELTGEAIETPVKGLTDPITGQAAIDPNTIERQWLGRIDNNVDTTGKVDTWIDETDPYIKPHVDAGRSPQDVREALAQRGGVEAEAALTVEHELVHVRVQGNYYTPLELADGTKVITNEGVNPSAPEELRKIGQDAIDEGVTHQDFIDLTEEMVNLTDQIDGLVTKQERVHEFVNLKGVKKSDQLAARKSLGEMDVEITKLKKKRGALQADTTRKAARKTELDDARRAFTESEAVEIAWKRMLDESWEARKFMKKFRRRHGISNIWRPWANPLTVTEYIGKKVGQSTLDRLARMTRIQDLRKHAGWASDADLLKLQRADTRGQVATILQDALNKNPTTQQPTIGTFHDARIRGMDSWEASHRFLGGTIAAGIRRQGRKWGASTGSNVLSITDSAERLNTIQNVLNTAGVDPDEISKVMAYSIKHGDRVTGIDALELKIEKLLTERILELEERTLLRLGTGRKLYEAADVELMFAEFRQLSRENRIYFASNQGKERPLIWDRGPHEIGTLDASQIKAEAVMEAQFATSSRVVPDVRRVRRLTSPHRTSMETYKKARVARMTADQLQAKVIPVDKVWNPKGFEFSQAAKAGDFGFGIWRDMQLLRGGWAFRVIPEESVRFMGAGYAQLFNNPLDYIISAFNNIDYKFTGDDLTLGDMLKHKESLGAAQLRDTVAPLHRVKGTGWTMVSRNSPGAERVYWGGITRHLVTMSHDPVTQMVAQIGVEKAFDFLSDTDEGKAILKRISTNAKKGGPLELVANADELNYYLDVIELQLAQIGGGKGVWFNPVTKQWEDLNDVVYHSATDRKVFNNKKTIRDHLTKNFPEFEQPKTAATRLDLEVALNDARGFDVDELNEIGKAAQVIDPGSKEINDLVANRKHGNISLDEELPFDSLRQLDNQWEELYEGLGVEPPPFIPAADSELMRMEGSTYNKVTDKLFYWLNSVPSTKLNRQPFFQQAFGNKLAQVYYFGDTDMRNAIDQLVESNRSMANAYRIGQRKLFKDFGIGKMPKPFNKWDRGGGDLPQPTPSEIYADAVGAGMYDEIPLEGGGHLTPQWVQLMKDVGNVEALPGVDQGMYAFRHGDDYDVGGALRTTENHVFHGSQTLRPTVTQVAETLEFNVAKVELEAAEQALAKSNMTGSGVPDAAAQSRVRNAQTEMDKVRSTNRSALDYQAAYDIQGELLDLDQRIVTARSTNSEKELSVLLAEQQKLSDQLDVMTKEYVDRFDTAAPDDVVLADLGYGGAGFNITRAERYANMGRGPAPTGEKWVTIVDRRHMPPHAQTHMNTIGDIEQFRNLVDEYPHLKVIPNLDTRFRQIWEDVRSRSDELMVKHDEMRVAALEELEKLGWKFDSQGNAVAVGETQRFFDQDGKPFEAYAPMQGGVESMEVATDVLYTPEMREIFENKYLFGRFLQDVQRMTPTPRQTFTQLIAPELGDEIGRPLTAKEHDALLQLLFERGENNEIIMIDELIKPVAQLPIDAYIKMMDQGWAATSPKGMGDTALALEKFSEPRQPNLVVTRSGTLVPDRVQEVMGRLGDDLNMVDEGGNTTQELFGANADDVDAINTDVINPENPAYFNQFTTLSGQTASFPDYGMYVSSSEFRGFVDDLILWEDDLGTRLVPYMDVGVTEMPQELWDELKHYAEAVEVAERGSNAFIKGENYFGEPIPYNNPILKHEQLGFDYIDANDMNAQTWAPVSGEAGGDYRPDGSLVPEASPIQSTTQRKIIDIFGMDGTGATQRLKNQILLGLENKPELLKQITRDVPGPGPLRQFNDEVLQGRQELKMDFDRVPQEERNASYERMFGERYGFNYDVPQVGSLAAEAADQIAGSVPRNVTKELDDILRTAKYDSIEETKALFYDLSAKSNVADALKFIFPFGDAWYEVLSRWATIMNPVKQGGQPLRNVRRAQVTGQAAKQSGFISTNEYGEEVFNWPITPGSAMNFFIPNSSNVSMTAKIPVSGMMFIEPSARGGLMPGVTPIVQLTNMLIAPATENIPVLADLQRWFVHGSKDSYQPGDPEEVSDILGLFSPTVARRIMSAVFDQGAQGTVGTTKMRLLEALMISGDAGYDPLDPRGAQRAWDVASTAGTWLAGLRILDSWLMPAQPQYSPEFSQEPHNTPGSPGYEESMQNLFAATDPDNERLGYEEVLREIAKLPYEYQQPLITIMSLNNEYRLAREIFGDSEADMYMIERHGVLPAVLQSSSEAIIEVPVSWGAIEWTNDNQWFNDIAPLTHVWGIPTDVDDTFSSKAWNDQFGTLFELEGIENTVIRRRRSASEIHEHVMRSVGYEQLRYEKSKYEKVVNGLRDKYGENYSTKAGYRAGKLAADQIYRRNKTTIYTEFPTIKPGNDGKIIGSTQGVTTQRRVDELIEIGSRGSDKNRIFRKNNPGLARVAEFYANELLELQEYSLTRDRQTAGNQWWQNSPSDAGEAVRKEFRRRSEQFYGSLDGHARDYANAIHERLLSALIDDWSWANKAWSQEIEIYPSVAGNDNVVTS